MKDVLWGMQVGVTVLAVVLGAIFAAYKWQVFRESEPHLTITHEVSHRPVGASYVHIAVTAVLHNSSKVKMEFREAFFLMQKISPVSDEEIEALYAEYAQAFEQGEYKNMQWDTLDKIPITWDEDVVIVEPGEMHQETCEFIVPKDVKSAIIYSYFYNSRVPQVPQGWGATTVHDIAARDCGSVDVEGDCNASQE